MTRSALPARGRQRGAAILLAMLILTLVATLAAGMVWHQWRGVEVESAERARTQGEWLLNGALDWARIILRSDARASSTDDLSEPWAMPLAESRLSDFLSTDPNHSDDSAPEAYLSGQIVDANARYNLYMLYQPQSGRTELAKLQALCTAIGVPVDVATTLFAGLTQSAATLQTQGGGTPPSDPVDSVLLPGDVDQITWYGHQPFYQTLAVCRRNKRHHVAPLGIGIVFQYDVGKRQLHVVGQPVRNDMVANQQGWVHGAGRDHIPVGNGTAEEKQPCQNHNKTLVVGQDLGVTPFDTRHVAPQK